MNLQEKLTQIQIEFYCPKTRFNKFGNYNYRTAEDIQEALKPFCKKYKVNFKTKETKSKEVCGVLTFKSKVIIKCNESNEQDFATAQIGVDLNQKGMAIPQRFGAASSYAKKYAYGNLLLIDDTADNDELSKNDIPIKEDIMLQEKKWLSVEQLNKTLSGTKKQADIVLATYKMKNEYKTKINNKFNNQ